MKSSFLYSLKVWLTAVFIAPLFVGIVMSFFEDIDVEIGMILFITILGFISSIPSWLLLFLAADTIYYLTENELQTQKRLAPIGLLLTFLPLILIFGFDQDFLLGVMMIGCPYTLCIIFGIFFYRLERKPISTPVDLNLER